MDHSYFVGKLKETNLCHYLPSKFLERVKKDVHMHPQQPCRGRPLSSLPLCVTTDAAQDLSVYLIPATTFPIVG